MTAAARLCRVPLLKRFRFKALDGRYDFSPVNNVHGSTLRQNVYSLDGVNTDDPITNATVTLLPPDAFQEVQVTTPGISAEFGDASGGVFNYITKSGETRSAAA